MLSRLAHIAPMLGKGEVDEIVGHLTCENTALKMILDKYISQFGVLPEFAGPQPEPPVDDEPEAPSETEMASTPEEGGE